MSVGRLPKVPRPWFLRWPGLALAAVAVAAYRGSEGDFPGLFSASALSAMKDFARGFWPPAHSAEFLGSLVRPLLETVAIAFLGISLALVLALPLSVLAASPEVLSSTGDRPSPLRRAAYHGARLTLNLMRSIPELIWALLFVRALGVGPGAGVLAIGVGYAGILGKVFSEIFESTPRGPMEGLASVGAPPARIFAFGVLPTATPLLASYALYRFDCALRSSAILGLVGAGGLGMQLELSMKMFAYDEVAALTLALFALVAAVDQLSRWFRRRLHQSRGLLPHGRWALGVRVALVAGWAAALVACGRFLELPLGELFSAQAAQSMGSFAADMFPADLELPFLASLVPAVLETLAVSVLGTLIAAALALALAYPAAARLHPGPRTASRGEQLLRGALAWVARGLFNLGRTLPELLWALVFIFALGLGPFAGALALGIHTAGVLGRLFSEVLEEVPPGPRHALEGAGARPWQGVVFGVLPQAFPQLVAFTLYRWEVNIRASAVVGVVGAGGLGKALHLALSLFHEHRVLTLLLVVLLLVTFVDQASAAIRRRVQRGGARGPVELEGEVLEAQVGPRRVLVLELSLRRAQLFDRDPQALPPVGEQTRLVLALPGGWAVACRGRIEWRRDEAAGTFAGVRLERLSPFGLWRLQRALAARPARGASVPAAVDAW